LTTEGWKVRFVDMVRIPAWMLGAARKGGAAHRRRPRLGITAIRHSHSELRQHPAAKSPLLEAIGRAGVKPAISACTRKAACRPSPLVVHRFAVLIHNAAAKKKFLLGAKSGQRGM
jgi:hypothetical protein